MPIKRNLVITFDAFGTLFSPRRPIAVQYAEVARSYNLSGFSTADIEKSFKNAFKEQSKKAPNYGRAVGMGPRVWWEEIIRNTFRPFTTPKMNLSQQMISELMHRFSSNAGYQLDSEVLPFFKHLRQLNSRKEISRTWPWQRTIVGVISNSDNRICGVLQSFGLAVIPRRTGALEKGEKTSVDKSEDISFVLCSYDAGYEKPDKRIFAAATDIVDRLGVKDANLVHVGDSKREDVLGAINAGWNAVLLNPQKEICEELLTADDIKETEETVKPNTREDYRIQRIGNLNDMWKWRPLY